MNVLERIKLKFNNPVLLYYFTHIQGCSPEKELRGYFGSPHAVYILWKNPFFLEKI